MFFIILSFVISLSLSPASRPDVKTIIFILAKFLAAKKKDGIRLGVFEESDLVVVEELVEIGNVPTLEFDGSDKNGLEVDDRSVILKIPNKPHFISRPFPSCVAAAGGRKPIGFLTRTSELRVTTSGPKRRTSLPQVSSDGGEEENPTGAVVWVGRRWPEKSGRVVGSGSGRVAGSGSGRLENSGSKGEARERKRRGKKWFRKK
ncbi:hypothetical protein ACLB2K_073091 [Fragaria x ananassa]